MLVHGATRGDGEGKAYRTAAAVPLSPSSMEPYPQQHGASRTAHFPVVQGRDSVIPGQQPLHAVGFSGASRLGTWGAATAATNECNRGPSTSAPTYKNSPTPASFGGTPTSLDSLEHKRAPTGAPVFGSYHAGGDPTQAVMLGGVGSLQDEQLARQPSQQEQQLSSAFQDRARSRERDRGRPLRMQDLVNEEDDDRFLPMEEDDDTFRSVRWRGYQGVSSLRENAFPDGPSSRTSLPPVSALSANSQSYCTGAPESFGGVGPTHADGPRSNNSNYYSQQLLALGTLALNDSQHQSYSAAPRPAPSPQSYSHMPTNYFVAPAAVSAYPTQAQQQPLQPAYMHGVPPSVPETPPRSTNSIHSMPAQSYGIRKSLNTPRSMSRAAERAALVSSLPSPRRKQPSDSLGSLDTNVHHGTPIITMERPSSSNASFELSGPSSSNGSKPAMRKCYIGAKSSQFCHVCRRSNKAEFALCSNLTDGSCRKVVCDRCFCRYGWSWQEYQDNPGTWKCAHCLELCPPKASCHLYSRINAGRAQKKEAKENIKAAGSTTAAAQIDNHQRRPHH
ncbi:hypothetical protein FVE85_3129 [Porphyridium purpureum]|uniref:Zinc-finger domain-containing protein n=1 Tax=Porphyridium purpureum TaxID=35688 RepID=A0A5J4YUL8_PORPP|nr:hypothetical protein FVE85_3129 [Porphyridium purpureum]|eukprot:POR0650..scf227_4